MTPVNPSLTFKDSSRQSSLVVLASLAVVVAALRLAREVLMPVALAILLSFLLAPLALRLERWKMARACAVTIVVVLALGVLSGVGWLVFQQMSELVQELPKHSKKIEKKIDSVRQEFQSSNREVKKILERVEKALSRKAPEQEARAAPAPGTPEAAGDGGVPVPPAPGTEERPISVRVVEGSTTMLKQALIAIGPLLDFLLKALVVSFL